MIPWQKDSDSKLHQSYLDIDKKSNFTGLYTHSDSGEH